ncbi:hypothetical protein [Marinigracilibium pacificum]|uniref:Uncharacterized protein n=1 Tax=Marinigracilibium pacificum TaxID=2729599 RepID=A0A848IVN1_9BACT|nr:hypothetical protein [Marinigracilibium pacificum]NMM47746.1 hypothetical protein [Marinigracilibium pacificum]
MKNPITKYFIIQLIIGFTLTIISINLTGVINDLDDYSKGRLLLLSFVGGLLFTLFNGIINSLNFTYPKYHNKLIAFYLPVMIWLIPLIFIISDLIIKNDSKHSDWLLILIWIEPILYNLILSRSTPPKSSS